MSSLSKCPKRSKGLSIRHREDRITNLPSSLVTKILSLLPTKDAVATSVLSTKWKRSWTSITNLEFDDNNLTNNPHNIDCDALSFRKFTSFVTRVLLLRDRSFLQKIRMKCYHKYDDSLVNAWLIAVLQCNVQELDISIRIKHPGLLPSDIFLCSSVVVLKLDARGSDVNMPISSCLPSLRTLHIAKVDLANDAAITSLLSGCPMLEQLSLRECVGKDVRVVNIIARVLKNLEIFKLPIFYINEANAVVNYQIVIDTPALEFLDFTDYVALSVVKMDYLIKAKIVFLNESNHSSWVPFRETRTEDIKDFLDGISQVEKLVLSVYSMMIISSRNPALPEFSKLTYLELNTICDLGWRFWPKLLESSPCLETLILLEDDPWLFPEVDVSLSFRDVPSCFLFHLKKVEIGTFSYYKNEMDTVECILKNAKVLEKLILHYYRPRTNTAMNVAKLFKELLSFHKASSVCKVVVLDA